MLNERAEVGRREVDTNTTVRGFILRQIARGQRNYFAPRSKEWDGPWRLLGPWWVRYWRWSDAFDWEPRRYDAIYIGAKR